MSPALPLAILLAALAPAADDAGAETLAWLENLEQQQAELSLAAWHQLAAERRGQLMPLIERAAGYYAAKAGQTRAGISPASQSHRLMAEFLAATKA